MKVCFLPAEIVQLSSLTNGVTDNVGIASVLGDWLSGITLSVDLETQQKYTDTGFGLSCRNICVFFSNTVH